MHVGDVNEPHGRYTVRRIVLPTSGTESFTVIGPDRRPVEIVDEYLGWLTNNERSPNTVEAYAHDLRAFWDVPRRARSGVASSRGSSSRTRPRAIASSSRRAVLSSRRRLLSARRRARSEGSLARWRTTEARDLLNRNKKAREIDRALTVLAEAGRMRRTILTDGRGRPAETWLPPAPPRAA